VLDEKVDELKPQGFEEGLPIANLSDSIDSFDVFLEHHINFGGNSFLMSLNIYRSFLEYRFLAG
jgi:hypothetical protein